MSKLIPMRGYVLIEPSDEDEVTASGLIMPERSKDKPSKGRVVAVGNPVTKYIEKIDPIGGMIPYEEYCEAKVGDTVVYQKWAGQDVKEGEKELRFVKFEDCLGVYED